MTEAEWLVCTDPTRMLKFLGDKASERKLRLFTCAFSRQFWSYFNDERSRKAIQIGDWLADLLANEQQREAAWEGADDALLDAVSKQDFERAAIMVYARRCVAKSKGEIVPLDYQFLSWTPSDFQLVRDIFGNPFHPVTINQVWLTPKVLALADTIYNDGAFERLPALADVLKAVGCDNEDILEHCRDDGPHARGCWVVDVV